MPPDPANADAQRSARTWRNALIVLVALVLAWDLYKLSRVPSSRDTQLDVAFHATFLLTLLAARWAERVPEGSPARRTRSIVPAVGMVVSLGLLVWRVFT